MRRTVVLIVMALVLAACQAAKPDPAAESKSEAVYSALGTGDPAPIIAQLPPQRNAEAMSAVIAKFHAMIPPGPPRSEKLVGVATAESPALGKIVSVSRQYDYADRTILFQSRFGQKPGEHGWALKSFNMTVATHQELARNRFTTTGRSPLQLGFLALAVASPIMMLLAAFSVIRARGLQLKWLWGLLSFGGLFIFRMNWATGVVVGQWSLQFIGFQIYHGPSAFTPWMITATLPVGAMIVLGRVWAISPRPPAQQG